MTVRRRCRLGHKLTQLLLLASIGNKPRLDGFINHLLSIATDKSERSDRSAQKAAIFLLMRTVQTWASQPGLPTAFLTEAALLNKESKKQVKVNGNVLTSGTAVGSGSGSVAGGQVVPGYETVAYERIVPAMFQTILDPEFKAKDGQASLVIHEVGNLLRELIAARGKEAVEYLESRLLPSTGCPSAAAQELLVHMRSETVKDFKKFFADFMKEWKAGLGSA